MKNPYKDALIAELNALAHAPDLMGLQHLAATWGATDDELAPSKPTCERTTPKKSRGRPGDVKARQLAWELAKDAVRLLRKGALLKNVHEDVTPDPALRKRVKRHLNNRKDREILEAEIDSEKCAI